MRATVDGGLTPGFSKAGDVLERGLTQAIRRGSLGFEDLRRVAFAALDAIATQSARALIPDLGGGDAGGGGLTGGVRASVPRWARSWVCRAGRRAAMSRRGGPMW
ncbi:hypothetical protein ACFSTD_03135 [Novosphingobium colocasiae]